MENILFLFGVGAMIIGSLYALGEKDLKRLLAYSSIAQVGYIYVGIGLGTRLGMTAACVQIIVHAVTKPMLFCTSGAFMSVSGGSKQFSALRGAGRRDSLSGIAFAVGALSMIGIPLFAGFVTKLTVSQAAIDVSGWKCFVALGAVIISTVLNALYYIPVLSVLFARREDEQFIGVKANHDLRYIIAIIAFILLNLLIGARSAPLTDTICAGLALME